MAGPPTMGRHARLQRVTQHKIIIRDTTLTEVFKDAHQGRQYEAGNYLLAATDGSVGKDEDGEATMGAGYCFLNQEIPNGIYHVDGEPASLRAEAAAMYKVLVAALGSTQSLVAALGLSRS